MNRAATTTHLALMAGAAVAPLFFIVVFAQAATRPGYSLEHVPLSLLSRGDGGWVQIADFIVCGILALIGAAGIRRLLAGHRGGVTATIFPAVYGAGLVVAGIFHPDAAAGFPPPGVVLYGCLSVLSGRLAHLARTGTTISATARQKHTAAH